MHKMYIYKILDVYLYIYILTILLGGVSLSEGVTHVHR